MRRPAAVLVALLLGACQSGQDPTVEVGGGEATAPTSAGAATSSTTPGRGLVPLPASTPAQPQRAHLTAVRASASADDGSRIVFEFDAAVPGYEIGYVDRPVTEDGSGDEVTVEGDAVLQVRLSNAAGARLEGERVIRTYAGPDRVPAGDGVAVEVVDAGDFEGVVTWVIGLRRRVPAVSLSSLSGPNRLVIDVPGR